MAWLHADSLDLYAAAADSTSAWDVVNPAFTLAAGRFTGSQAMSNTSAGLFFTKNSGSNDGTHHVVCAFNQTGVLGGTSANFYFTLSDAANAQCTIVFRSDGTILLQSGAVGGATLATYSGAYTQNVWNGFEFEVAIHNTAGAFHVRKNGNTSDDFTATSLNTRPVSANSYANRLLVGCSLNSIAQRLDDILWFSTAGAAPNAWVGDIRSCQLSPVSDATVQFAKAPATVSVSNATAANTNAKLANTVYTRSLVATATGTVSNAIFGISGGFTGNMKAALYAANGTNPAAGPGTVLATSNTVTNPTAGNNTCTFASPPSVVNGTTYWLALITDAAFTVTRPNVAIATNTFAQSFASAFPTDPAWTQVGGANANNFDSAITIVPTNAFLTSDVTQDGLTSYVYDSTVGHADFYNMSDLPFVPVSIIGLVTRGFVEKSDAGLRQAQLQLKSGATTVQSTTLTLATSFVYTSRVDTVDPNTSAAWTAAAVNAVQAGPYVTA